MKNNKKCFNKNRSKLTLKLQNIIWITFTLCIILSYPIHSKAQVEGVTISINQLDIAANLYHVEDLINSVSIEYSGEETLIICLVATITNTDDGASVCVTGQNYTLYPQPFPQQLIRSNFRNVDISGEDQEYVNFIEDVALRTGSLPGGTYLICVEAYYIEECTCYASGNCIEQKVFLPSPPELIYPVNESEIIEDLPVFSWLPPMPSYGVERYSLQIVEINDGQSPIEAMEANAPWFLIEGLEFNSYQFSLAEREFIPGQRYAWKVTALIGPGENSGNDAVVVSPVWSFKFGSLTDSLTLSIDSYFQSAFKMLKDSVDINTFDDIYGVIDPIPEGATIESEDPTEFERIPIENESFLFIIDEEPGTRFGHPVQYVLVDTEANTVKIYQANWFPVVRNSIDRFKEAGETNIEEIDVKLLEIEEQSEITEKASVAAESSVTTKEVEKVVNELECRKRFLIINGGDFERTGVPTEQAKKGAKLTESLAEFYENEGFKPLRFSQFKNRKNSAVDYLPVDKNRGTAKSKIIDEIVNFYNDYEEHECCALDENEDLELVIYIWANAVPESTTFKIYNYNYDIQNEDIAVESIDYKEDILEYLSLIPSCVKLTLYVGDCFKGEKPITQRLDLTGTLEQRGGPFEIITKPLESIPQFGQ